MYLCKSFYSHPSFKLPFSMLKLFGKFWLFKKRCLKVWTFVPFANNQISNFSNHLTRWHLSSTNNIDLRWSSAVGSWLQLLDDEPQGILWGTYVNRQKSTWGYPMQLMEWIHQHLSEYGSPVSLKTKVLVMKFHPGLPRFEQVFKLFHF